METRPLCMKNCFNEIIVAADCSAMNAEYFKITHKTQNGFTGGHFIIKNLVANDSAGRMHSCGYEGSKKPFLAPSTISVSSAFDFLAAFPQLSMIGSGRFCLTGNFLITTSTFSKPTTTMLKLCSLIMVLNIF